MQYTLVYDASAAGLDLGMLPVAILGAVVAVALLVFRARARRWIDVAFLSAFLLAWIIGFSIGLYAANYRRVECAELARTGQYAVSEGRISDFHPMPYGGHALESFTLNGVRFEYSDYDLSKGGFNQTQSHGGPLREGLDVRIAHNEGRILKIWILQAQP